jgi:hypothetical protein
LKADTHFTWKHRAGNGSGTLIQFNVIQILRLAQLYVNLSVTQPVGVIFRFALYNGGNGMGF